ncbi:DNA binding domain-containing protein, excisionase family [Novosphingobium aromaticivorans]|uniref:helix-turn-helix domain-containing protein n=1 Tax=Novosphingobium aromaticivorans TaxID=48935 RepID=UPI00003C7C13|nr:helix-turn-helix domain-containing protein [Novosphingobium aromaticivorans]SCY20141.1 DNA binding domain-containing protein, excisionase family [Novosphingobium aromaticivorans]
MLVSINDATKLLGLGRSTIYRLFRERKLDFLKVGRRTLIPASSLEKFVSMNGTDSA